MFKKISAIILSGAILCSGISSAAFAVSVPSAVQQTADNTFHYDFLSGTTGTFSTPIASAVPGQGNLLWVRVRSLGDQPLNVFLYKYQDTKDTSSRELVMNFSVEGNSVLTEQEYTAEHADSASYQIIIEAADKTSDINFYLNAGQSEYEPFTDVQNDSWSQEYIAYVYQNELFSGTSATTFSPESPLTRAQMVTVLGNMHQKITGQAIKEQKSSFPDVSADSYYAKYTAWAQQNGLAAGYSDGKFHPDDNITREQAAVIINKYIEMCGTVFEVVKDYTPFQEFNPGDYVAVKISDWAEEAVENMGKYGIMSGNGFGSYFYPKRNLTRSEAAVIITHLYQNLSK